MRAPRRAAPLTDGVVDWAWRGQRARERGAERETSGGGYNLVWLLLACACAPFVHQHLRASVPLNLHREDFAQLRWRTFKREEQPHQLARAPTAQPAARLPNTLGGRACA
jgi:hypothetical protein